MSRGGTRHLDVVFQPRDAKARQLEGRAVVVLDVLRATTTMAAALAAGVKEIRVFGDLDAAAAAAKLHQFPNATFLCGERQCLPPPGFDLGNSPGAFTPELHRGATLFMATTNGTRAIAAAAAGGAARIFTAALVNASAVARQVTATNIDVTLLCAGTDGELSMEDVIGAGAILDAIRRDGLFSLVGDTSRVAWRLFDTTRHDLPAALRDAQGGRNVIAADLREDVDFAARLDVLDAVGEVVRDPLRVVPAGRTV